MDRKEKRKRVKGNAVDKNGKVIAVGGQFEGGRVWETHRY